MARIKIEDLPVMEDMNKKELKGIFGGTTLGDVVVVHPFPAPLRPRGFQAKISGPSAGLSSFGQPVGGGYYPGPNFRPLGKAGGSTIVRNPLIEAHPVGWNDCY